LKSGSEIRQLFLDYFKSRSHQEVPSSSLIPEDDPSVLLTTAGMQQFKPYFLGERTPPAPRLTSVQKCFRTSDIDEVGDETHCTFFEMLGNFSVGDYFKAGAVAYGLECLVETYGLPVERIWATVFAGEEGIAGEKGIPVDEEAIKLWEDAGIPSDRIHRFGKKDNFWGPPGATGPCGPCSELHYELTTKPCGLGERCVPNCECGRFVEIWNLVFMQYNKDDSGSYDPLPSKNIDTGAGLERIAMILQGVPTIFETDLFAPIASAVVGGADREITSVEDKRSMRIICDHLRGATFLAADGVIPANEGRGYVLRRIIRRAAVHGRKLGYGGPFLHRLSGIVVDMFREAYPELADRAVYLARMIGAEEDRFADTLETGLRIFEAEVARIQGAGEGMLPGEVIFKLYDTYGFPADLTRDLAVERGLQFDENGFDRSMEGQREMARSAWKGEGDEEASRAVTAGDLEGRVVETSFLGYELETAISGVEAIIVEGAPAEAAAEGRTVELLVRESPFYGEAGGQVGDRGAIHGRGGDGEVTDARSIDGRWIVHRINVTRGEIRVGDKVELRVDPARRAPVRRNHTATHLLQAMLRRVLGDHVKQAGSLVAPERLRFDFTHFSPVKPREIAEVEALVNEKVRENHPVTTEIRGYREALAGGATALFGEKYGDEVRVVGIEEFSAELCGGTHCGRTGDIGIFKIVGETGVAAGVRRIEALTGKGAFQYVQKEEEELRALAELLQAQPGGIVEKVRRLQADNQTLRKAVEAVQKKASRDATEDLVSGAREVAGVKVIAARVSGHDARGLRELADLLRDKLGSGVVLLGAEREGKALLLAAVTKDLTGRFHAGNLVRELAAVVGGKGGGRPDMAQAGGTKPEKLDEALAGIDELLME